MAKEIIKEKEQEEQVKQEEFKCSKQVLDMLVGLLGEVPLKHAQPILNVIQQGFKKIG